MPSGDRAPGAGRDSDLGYLLRQAAGVHRIRIDRALHGLGVTAPQFLVLTLVAGHPGCSGADLARLTMLTMPTVSVIVSRLVDTGMVSRRSHATHGRIRHLDLTPAGADLLDRCKACAAPVEAELEQGLSDADAARIRDWLVRATGVTVATGPTPA